MGTEISPMQLKVAVALVATLVAAASAFSTTPSLALRRSTPAASTRRPTVLALSMQEDKENATPEDQENATPESVTPVKQTTGFGKLGKNLMDLATEDTAYVDDDGVRKLKANPLQIGGLLVAQIGGFAILALIGRALGKSS